jgi:3-oxoadipate enol-lactonase
VKSLTVAGTDLSYVERGAGIPLLLVHGFPLDHTMWAGQIDALAGQTAPSGPRYRVIAPDLRGFGRSPAQNDKVTMDQFADDLAALLDGLSIDQPVVLCGLSMGGYIAFQFWRKYAAGLRALILCDTRAAADAPEAAAGRFAVAERVLREGPAPLVESMMPRLFADATCQRQPELVEQIRSVMLATDPRAIAAATRGMAERPDMTPALGQIRCPTLVLVGQNDVISTPAEMRGIAAAIPDARFVEISAAGHMAPLENPTEVNAAITAFLARV